jgi:hypothetical protein
MKTVSSGMASHLSQEVTTLCTCWKIVRQDGQVFGFTDHDMDLVIDGLTYESETGYNRTAIRSDASFSVDNLDVTGFLESDRISENDLRNGLFDFAKVYIFAVNWANLTLADIKLRRGWFGEVTLDQNGMFETEIRGLHQALSTGFMESYQPECRADFCDPRCKLVYADFIRDAFVFDWETKSQFYVSSGVPGTITLSVGAHRYWRFVITAAGPGETKTALAEVMLYGQDGSEILGGAVTASQQIDINRLAVNTRDKNATTAWGSFDFTDTWLKLDFGIPKDVQKFKLQAPNGIGDATVGQAPTAFSLEYSDNNIDWTTADTYTTPAWTVPAERRSFVGFGGGLTFSAMGAPAAGMTTYIGGTVKFTSGPNTGKIIEIVSYDAVTGLVTMFEDFPYPITPGDLFEFVQGCDKMFDTCKLYNNEVNFRGEPHVPGQDALLSYPDAHD